MRFPIIFLFIMFLTLSCGKEDNDLDKVPNWLQEKIDLWEKDSFPGSAVYEYKWNGSVYYNFVNPVSSCAFCEFYDYNGNKYEWSAENFDDFNKNAIMVGTVWEEGF